ncbi:MAG TPA: Asp-tRNA(Asn)/Glu-tRNA(Gln) amidotransferase GatCAB subunit A [Sutterella sp.]|nr:Asp-tRNA(Asn)/Glu-tRNA(Gln) amidotransferase GatCAB subunit A [Sutterella sp.]
MTFANLTVTEIRSMLDAGKVSSVELATDFLDRIAARKDLNAFLDVRPEVTMKQAQAADKLRAEGKGGPLCGIPIAHKDIFVTRDFASTAASHMLEGYMSPFDATVVSKLYEAGTVCLGKLNCDEYAMGGANENSAYGPVLNPWDKSCVPGGSSGGSAACVAAGLAPVATGTDTGGSIRLPAVFCGVTGIKPTYGRPSRYGMIPFASSLDTAGVLAKTARDCALVLSHMTGFDPRDSTSIDMPVEDFSRDLGTPVSGMKIGVPWSWFEGKIDEHLVKAIEEAVKVYESLGVTIVPVDLPNAHLGVPVYYVVACAEASSNLGRYDGVRYGYRAPEFSDIHDMIRKSRSQAFGDEPKRRILIGTYVLSHGYYDAYYIKAQQVRRLIARDFTEVFKSVDALLMPASTGPAYPLGSKANPVDAYLADLYTTPVSLAGLPSIGMPCGKHASGLPLGVQLVCPAFQEARLLQIADAFQSVTDWHQMRAPGF